MANRVLKGVNTLMSNTGYYFRLPNDTWVSYKLLRYTGGSYVFLNYTGVSNGLLRDRFHGLSQ